MLKETPKIKRLVTGYSMALAIALLSVPQSCSAVVATLPLQIVQWVTSQLGNAASIVEEVATASNTANQVQQQIQTVQQGSKNLESLSPSNIATWNRYIDQLGGVMAQTNGLAYSMANIDTKFSENFPEYDDMVNKGKTGDINQQAGSFAEMYKTLTDRNRGTALGTLKNLKKTGDYLADDEVTLNQLKLSSDNTTGNLQVMQAANRIAVHQTQTLKDLHYTMLSQQNLMAQQLATENQRNAAARAKTTAWKENSLKRTKGNERSIKTWRE